jgi:hypothetical protein
LRGGGVTVGALLFAHRHGQPRWLVSAGTKIAVGG